MRSTRSVRSFLVAALAVLAVGCSSEAATSGNSSNGGGDVSNGETAGSVAADPGTPAVESTSAPAPVTDGAWPPADACTLLDQATAEALTGETLAFAPVPLSGEFAYGPYCEYTSDASGLFMVVSTYSPADLASVHRRLGGRGSRHGAVRCRRLGTARSHPRHQRLAGVRHFRRSCVVGADQLVHRQRLDP
jgi:hypothetical protein